MQINAARARKGHRHGVNPALDMLMAWCGALPADGGVIFGMLLAGLAGSPMHCAPMCGGFVLGQVADGMARMPVAAFCEWRRIGAAALVPYHLGRLTTYGMLGAAAGLCGAGLDRLPWLGRLSGTLLLLAAGLFMMQALRRVAPALGNTIPALDRAPDAWVRLVQRATRRLDRSRPLSGFRLGLMLGLLPCGFLYAALIAAAASGGALTGAVAMLVFGAGTVPALIAVGVTGQAAGRHFRRATAALAPAIMVANGIMLAVLAVRGLV